MDELFGLPSHPLLVHIPVVLLPLAAVGVVVMAIRTAWHRRFRWAVLAITAVGTLGAVLAASAGESFEERVEAVEGRDAARRWHDHAESGDTARNVALLFLATVVAFVLVPWWLDRRASTGQATVARSSDRWLRVGAAAVAIAAGVGSMVTIVDAGHSGADSVWEKYDSAPDG